MATVPVEMTFVAGAVLTAAQLNTNVRDAVNFIIAPPLCVMRQTSGQSLTASSYTVVTWDTEDIDRDGGHSTSSNPSRYTSQTAGWYDLASTIVWPTAGISTGWLGVLFQTNGNSANRFAKLAFTAATTFNVGQTTTGKIYLNVGDYVETLAANGTGGTGTMATASDGNPRSQIQWVSS